MSQKRKCHHATLVSEFGVARVSSVSEVSSPVETIQGIVL
jgi:hypothetical protein